MKMNSTPKTLLFLAAIGLLLAASQSAFAGDRRGTAPPPPAGSGAGPIVSLP